MTGRWGIYVWHTMGDYPLFADSMDEANDAARAASDDDLATRPAEVVWVGECACDGVRECEEHKESGR